MLALPGLSRNQAASLQRALQAGGNQQAGPPGRQQYRPRPPWLWAC
jgi:hypothetical protein